MDPAGFSPQALAALQERVESLLPNEDVEFAMVQDQAGPLLAQAGTPGSDLRWFRTEMTTRAWASPPSAR